MTSNQKWLVSIPVHAVMAPNSVKTTVGIVRQGASVRPLDQSVSTTAEEGAEQTRDVVAAEALHVGVEVDDQKERVVHAPGGRLVRGQRNRPLERQPQQVAFELSDAHTISSMNPKASEHR